MENSKISVIVPVYNVEKYLRGCIESLINQKYSNIEILLVDDGSTDGSGAICDEYAKSDSRVVVIHKANGGLSDARNVGLDKAKGDFISFVDSDDFVAPDFLQRLYDIIKAEDVDIAECSHGVVTEGGDMPSFESDVKKENRLFSFNQWMTETGLGKFLSVVVWNKLYKRYLWNDVRFPKGRIYEDDSTTYKIVFKAQKVFRTYDRLYFYRQRNASITQSDLSDKKKQDHITALNEQTAFFEAKGMLNIVDFVKAKKCLLLIDYYFRVLNKTEKKAYRKEVKEIFKEIKGDKTVPAKYKRFIRLFSVCPTFAKILYERGRK